MNRGKNLSAKIKLPGIAPDFPSRGGIGQGKLTGNGGIHLRPGMRMKFPIVFRFLRMKTSDPGEPTDLVGIS